MIGRPPSSTPVPYPPLFRSLDAARPVPGDGPGTPGAAGIGWHEPARRVAPRGAVGGLASRPGPAQAARPRDARSEEPTSELQSPFNLVSRLLLENTTHLARA